MPETTLLEIDLRYRAKELERFAHARTLLELKLSDMSARQLGRDDEKEEDDENKGEFPFWEARGLEIKEKLRDSLLYAFAPEHIRAAMTLAKGGEQVKPLRISPAAARTILEQLEKEVFTHGAWQESQLREQLKAPGARKRLEAAARGRPDKRHGRGRG